MSKQQLQLNREQQAHLQDKLRSKIGPALISNKRESTEKYDNASDDTNRVAYQNRNRNQVDDECNTSPSSHRYNQEEEIRRLHEQLEQREFDLKEMRYKYVTSLKSNKVGNDVNMNHQSDEDDTQALKYFNNNRDSGLNAYDVDEDEESSFSSHLIRQSLPSSTQQKRSQTDVQTQGNRGFKTGGNELRSSLANPKMQSIGDISIANNKKQSGCAASSSSSLPKSRSSSNHGSLLGKGDAQSRDSQVIDLIEFRNTATKEYEKLRSAYELLKVESEEKRSIVEDTCGRLIRFISGTQK